MEFTKEVKQAFIDRMGEKNLIVVTYRYGKTQASFQHKIIGMKDGLRWDFTPLIADLSGANVNTRSVSNMAVRGFSDEIFIKALRTLRKEGFAVWNEMIESPHDFYGHFSM